MRFYFASGRRVALYVCFISFEIAVGYLSYYRARLVVRYGRVAPGRNAVFLLIILMNTGDGYGARP